MNTSPEYVAFANAIQRCTNPNSPDYRNYGGRGIELRFNSFAEWVAELGPRPAGVGKGGRSLYSVDRIDNDGHYEVGNVRWGTKEQQLATRRGRGAAFQPKLRAPLPHPAEQVKKALEARLFNKKPPVSVNNVGFARRKSIPLVSIIVRHSADCAHKDDRYYKRCACKKHLEWFADGVQHRVSAKTRSWTIAEEVKRAVVALISTAMGINNAAA